MSHARLVLALVLLGCGPGLAGAGCSDDAVDPLIEALLPARGKPGAVVDVVGERFTAAAGHLHFGGVPAQVLIWSERRVRVTVPDAGLSGVTLVVLTAGGRPSNAVSFLVEGTPKADAGFQELGPLSDGPIVDLPGADAAVDLAVDLAPDAPPPDLGAPDTVAPDAGAPEAAAPEAGAPDIGAADATPDVAPDAASGDAVAPDAVTPDAAAPDAAAPDAAAPDAATPDGASAG